MSWLGLVLLVLGLYLAFKLVGAFLKIAMFVLALVGAYWFVAPHLGWPSVSELVYVLGPDLGGRRIEDLADPSRLAKDATDHVVEGVVDGVVERFDPAQSAEAAASAGGTVDAPAPLPEDSAGAPAEPTR